jgi:hypothetical protein
MVDWPSSGESLGYGVRKFSVSTNIRSRRRFVRWRIISIYFWEGAGCGRLRDNYFVSTVVAALQTSAKATTARSGIKR